MDNPLNAAMQGFIEQMKQGLQELKDNPKFRKYAEYKQMKTHFGDISRMLDEDMQFVSPAGQNELVHDLAQPIYDADERLQSLINKIVDMPHGTPDERKDAMYSLTETELVELRIRSMYANFKGMLEFTERILERLPNVQTSAFN